MKKTCVLLFVITILNQKVFATEQLFKPHLFAETINKAAEKESTDKTERKNKIQQTIESSKAITKSVTYKVKGKAYRTLASHQIDEFEQEGKASWYGGKFHGRKTASGEVFNKNNFTAAHKELPLGTKVEVTNLDNGKSIIVKVNDRGPFHGNRIIDLSQAAAQKIGIIKAGVGDVKVRVIK